MELFDIFRRTDSLFGTKGKVSLFIFEVVSRLVSRRRFNKVTQNSTKNSRFSYAEIIRFATLNFFRCTTHERLPPFWPGCRRPICHCQRCISRSCFISIKQKLHNNTRSACSINFTASRVHKTRIIGIRTHYKTHHSCTKFCSRLNSLCFLAQLERNHSA